MEELLMILFNLFLIGLYIGLGFITICIAAIIWEAIEVGTRKVKEILC